MTTPGWWLGHHEANPYLAFTDRCNAQRPRVILASGQACVWYRLALASKDGDWIIRETGADCEAVLTELAACGARYRLGAPLHPRWLAAGWSSHFEAVQADGVRLRFDFVSRPPRVPDQDLDHLWHWVDGGHPAVVRRTDLIRLKQTMRLKDYPFIGALALALDDPEDIVRWTLDAEVILDLVMRHPALRDRLPTVRPGLATVPLEHEALLIAIDQEIRAMRTADEARMTRYHQALGPWAERFRAMDFSACSLTQTHDRLVTAADGLLPDHVPW